MANLDIAFGSNTPLTLKYKDRRLEIKSYGEGAPTRSGKIDELNRVSDNPLQLTLSRFELVKKIAGLDGDSNNISDKDLKLAKNLKGSVFGNNYVNQYKLTNIEDAGNGRTVFTLTMGSDKAYLEIDAETDEERAVREKNEKAVADEKKAKEAEEQRKREAKARQDEEERYWREECNDPISKFLKWLGF